MDKCKPHYWDVPKLGDDALTCLNCGRVLKYQDMSLNMLSSIHNSIEMRRGPAVYEAFLEARRDYVRRAPPVDLGEDREARLEKLIEAAAEQERERRRQEPKFNVRLSRKRPSAAEILERSR